ncbi:hypothetical protein [Cyanobium sp. ATX 6F1]|uniref:hypothetical protein n=1 Tax=unclassified Cyanobium TaxID=2627006 RepID=UPI0020CE5910|nr:hypothetical protein [Cyanobium sp. ATX 6F1]MCP9916338.1 hypothetical protein [Cyanobium sp. ATX 6F1]
MAERRELLNNRSQQTLSGPRPAAPQRWVVRYRGFVLIPQDDLTWLVRPERSPMRMLPFRAPASSIDDVKALVDWRLETVQAA